MNVLILQRRVFIFYLCVSIDTDKLSSQTLYGLLNTTFFYGEAVILVGEFEKLIFKITINFRKREEKIIKK